jgi:hypothetical protein
MLATTVHEPPKSGLPALVELGLVMVLGSGVLASTPDLTPLLQHFFGFEWDRSQFAIDNPVYPLLMGCFALCLLVYVLRLSLRVDKHGVDRVLNVVGWIIMVLAITTPAARDMFLRATIDNVPGNERMYVSHTHDGGVLQTELAIDAVLAGENPYSLDYGNSEMARARDSDAAGWRGWGYEHNPAFDHVPYLPAMFLLPLPLNLASEAAFDWYDQRVFYILAFFVFIWATGRLVRAGRPRRIVWLLTGLSPLLLPFIQMGRNDIALLAVLALFALAVKRDKVVLAAGLLGVACASKQFAWATVPFFAVWLSRRESAPEGSTKWSILAFVGVMALFCLPFFITAPGAFLDDTLAFNLGLTADAYPLRPDSTGMASLVFGLGWATSLRDGFPMWVFQAAVTLPLITILLLRLYRRPTLPQMYLYAGVVTFTTLFFSAFFAFNYWAIPAYLLLYSGLALQDETDGSG